MGSFATACGAVTRWALRLGVTFVAARAFLHGRTLWKIFVQERFAGSTTAHTLVAVAAALIGVRLERPEAWIQAQPDSAAVVEARRARRTGEG